MHAIVFLSHNKPELVVFEIYTKANLHKLKADPIRLQHPILNYLIPLVEEGSKSYTENSDCEFGLLQMGDFFFPFSFNEKAQPSTYLTSLDAQFFGYLIDEIKNQPKYSATMKRLGIPVLKLGRIIFRAFGSKKVLMLNNWLVSTNLIPSFSFIHFKAPLRELEQLFSNQIILFKGLNEGVHDRQMEDLKLLGFLPVVSRLNFVLDTREKVHLKKRPMVQDIKRWKAQNELNWHSPPYLNDNEKQNVIDQYKSVYLKKYSRLNPEYKFKFLDKALQGGFLRIDLLKKGGDIVGVQAVSKSGQEITTPFIGYDQSQPQDAGLYRHLNVNLISEADDEGKILNMSSGAGKFKNQRGGEPRAEYHMLYVAHLPLAQRLFWGLFSKLSCRYVKPSLIKAELG